MKASSGAERTIECTANGKSLSRKGEHPLVAKAQLTFIESWKDGLRILKKIRGTIKATDADYQTVAEAEADGVAYIGRFRIGALAENAKYRPAKYNGYSRFQDFDATDTAGSTEDGMWGSFLLEKRTDKRTFGAHYIFKAGYHMGGTLHLSCKYKKQAKAGVGRAKKRPT